MPGALSPDRLLFAGAIVAVSDASASDRRPAAPADLRRALAARARRRRTTLASAFFAGTLFERDDVLQDRRRVRDPAVPRLPRCPLAFRTERQRHVLLGTLVALGAYLGLTVAVRDAGAGRSRLPEVHPRSGLRHPSRRAAGVRSSTPWRTGSRSTCAPWPAPSPPRRGAARRCERSPWRSACCALSARSSAWSAPSGSAPCSGRESRCSRRAACAATSPTSSSSSASRSSRRWRVIPGLSESVSQRANEQGTIWDRKNLARAAANMVEAKPLLGFGWSRFAQDSADYFEQSPDYPLTATSAGVHNTPLDLCGRPRARRDDALDRGRAVRCRRRAGHPRAAGPDSSGGWGCWLSRPRTSSC